MITRQDIVALSQALNRFPLSMAETLYFDELLKRLDKVAQMMATAPAVEPELPDAPPERGSVDTV